MSAISSNLSSLAASSSGASSATGAKSLSANDFISLMVTQLQNQDPLNPTSSTDLLSQVSEIGQLQSSESLNTTLSSLATNTNIGSASSMLGKTVSGINTDSAATTGTVTSVKVTSNGVQLSLDNGDEVALSNVSNIAKAGSASPATATGS